MQPSCTVLIHVGSVCRCQTIVVVFNQTLLRRMCEMMSTQFSCCTFHWFRKAWATNGNYSGDSTNCFRLRVLDENMYIRDATCSRLCHLYCSAAHIVTILRCSVFSQSRQWQQTLFVGDMSFGGISITTFNPCIYRWICKGILSRPVTAACRETVKQTMQRVAESQL